MRKWLRSQRDPHWSHPVLQHTPLPSGAVPGSPPWLCQPVPRPWPGSGPCFPGGCSLGAPPPALLLLPRPFPQRSARSRRCPVINSRAAAVINASPCPHRDCGRAGVCCGVRRGRRRQALSSAVSALPAARGPSPSRSSGMFPRAQQVRMVKEAVLERVILLPCPTRPKHPPRAPTELGCQH